MNFRNLNLAGRKNLPPTSCWRHMPPLDPWPPCRVDRGSSSSRRRRRRARKWPTPRQTPPGSPKVAGRSHCSTGVEFNGVDRNVGALTHSSRHSLHSFGAAIISKKISYNNCFHKNLNSVPEGSARVALVWTRPVGRRLPLHPVLSGASSSCR